MEKECIAVWLSVVADAPNADDRWPNADNPKQQQYLTSYLAMFAHTTWSANLTFYWGVRITSQDS